MIHFRGSLSNPYRTALLIAAIFACGCAPGIVTLTHQSSKVTSDGVSYFLPTNHVRIVFTNDTIVSEVKAATDALTTVKKGVETATTELEAAEKSLAAADPKNAAEIKKLEEAVVTGKKTLATAKAKVSAAEAVLAEAKKAKEQILVEVLPPVADPSQVYVARLDHWPMYNDKVTFKTSADGLLTQVTLKAEDQTREIVQNLVQTAIEGAKLYARLQGVPIPPTELEAMAEVPRRCTPLSDDTKKFYWEFTIDPSDPDAVALVNWKLVQTSVPFLVNIRAPSTKYKKPGSEPRSLPGLYYRRPLPYTIDLLEDAKAKEELCNLLREIRDRDTVIAKTREFVQQNAPSIPTSQSKQVVMAAGGPVSLLKLDSRPFVTTDITATFKDGLLLETSETRPSEALGVAEIPLDTVMAVGNTAGDIIDNIVPIKIDWTNKNTALIEAETALLQAQKDKADLQKQLLEQIGAPNPAPAAGNP